jgi:hypothetical protein
MSGFWKPWGRTLGAIISTAPRMFGMVLDKMPSAL